MTMQKIILISVLCSTIIGLAGQTRRLPSKFPRLKSGMTKEEYRKENEKAVEEAKKTYLKMREERMRLMEREAWKHLLRVNEQQWKILEPKIYTALGLLWATQAGATGWGGLVDFYWHRHSESFMGAAKAKAPNEMIEGERLADELVDLLEDKNSKDEEIRQQMHALQQAREQARESFPQARKELAEVLTNTRQEAIFLIRGYID